MGDVAQILRGSQPPSKSRLSPIPGQGASGSGAASVSAGVPRALAMQSKASAAALEVLRGSGDAGAEDLPPAVPTTVKVGSKRVAVQKACRPWAWAPFCSSSRTDGLMLHHWVRAGVEYPDYPFARFDVHLDPVTYTDEEYEQYLASDESAHALAKDTGSSDTPAGAGSSIGSRKGGSKASQTSSSGSPQNKSRHNKPDSDQARCHVAPWTKSETDALLEVCRKYELRWPVIHDRWMSLTAMSSSAGGGGSNSNSTTRRVTTRSVEELQQRYYAVAAVLMQHRIVKEARAEVQALSAGTAATPTGLVDPSQQQQLQQQQQFDANVLLETAAARQLATADPGSQPVMVNFGQGATNKQFFDFDYEQGRRAHWEALWKRTAEQDKEEAAIRRELKQVEAQLRKIKKAGAHIVAAKGGGNASGSDKVTAVGGRMSGAGSRSVTPVPAALANLATSDAPSPVLDQAFATTAPKPVPQTPYLQSARMVQPATGGAAGLNKTLLQRMETVLAECKVPQPRPTVATKRVCDLYDAVRKQTLTLLILQKQILQREGVLEAKRLKVAKLTGTATATVGSSFSVSMPTEEALLGMAPPPAPVSASAAATAAVRKAGARPTKKQQQQGSSASTTSVSKKKSAPKTAAPSSAMDIDPVPKATMSAAGATTARPGNVAAVGGKQQAAAVKQARKTAPKRKRKAESKSPAPVAVTNSGITMTASTQPSTANTSTTVSQQASVAPAVATPSVSAAAAAPLPPADEASKGASAKKRARKS